MMRRAGQPIRNWATAIAVIVAIAGSMGVTALPSTAKFTRNDTTTGTFSSDTVKPATAVAVTSDTVNQLNLAWTPSLTSYVTGYKVQRSTTATGPWSQVGTIGSRTTTAFTNTGTGMNRYFYRLDATGKGWAGLSSVVQAPVPKGSIFKDGWAQTLDPARNIDGQPTEDGDSVWQVWSGGVTDGVSSAAWGTSDTVPNIAVVETPTQNAQMYGRDMDGVEALVIRGKDAQNYISVCGAGPQGSFEITEVRNGVRTVLKSTTVSTNNSFRLEAIGNTITVYESATDATSGGTQLMTATTNYLLGDPAAHWFGVGFYNSHGGMTDMKFVGLP